MSFSSISIPFFKKSDYNKVVNPDSSKIYNLIKKNENINYICKILASDNLLENEAIINNAISTAEGLIDKITQVSDFRSIDFSRLDLIHKTILKENCKLKLSETQDILRLCYSLENKGGEEFQQYIKLMTITVEAYFMINFDKKDRQAVLDYLQGQLAEIDGTKPFLHKAIDFLYESFSEVRLYTISEKMWTKQSSNIVKSFFVVLAFIGSSVFATLSSGSLFLFQYYVDKEQEKDAFRRLNLLYNNNPALNAKEG